MRGRCLPVSVIVGGLLINIGTQAEEKKVAGYRIPKFEKVTLEPLAPAELQDDAKWQLDPNLGAEARKQRLAEIDAAWKKPGYRNEGAAVFDVNKDGALDITAGAWWYQGPDFAKKHPIRDLPQEGEFCKNFGEFAYDLNSDGWTDIITGSWMARDLVWYENPGAASNWESKWTMHKIDTSRAFLEGMILVDLDGDKVLDILPNTHENGKAPVYFIKVTPGKPPTFTVKDVGPTGGGHGVGAGDINGDGRPEIICAAGWYEAPQDALKGTWKWHPEKNPVDDKQPWLGMAGLPVQVFDVNRDGRMDIIYGQGHSHGTAWYEHTGDAEGAVAWIHHVIDKDWSQAHTWAPVKNLAGAGEVGFITGKRIRGHGSGDPGSLDPRCVYYYVHNPEKPGFDRHVISERDTVATGMNINVIDIDNDGDLDIVVPGKSGLYLLRNTLKKKG